MRTYFFKNSFNKKTQKLRHQNGQLTLAQKRFCHVGVCDLLVGSAPPDAVRIHAQVMGGLPAVERPLFHHGRVQGFSVNETSKHVRGNTSKNLRTARKCVSICLGFFVFVFVLKILITYFVCSVT